MGPCGLAAFLDDPHDFVSVPVLGSGRADRAHGRGEPRNRGSFGGPSFALSNINLAQPQLPAPRLLPPKSFPGSSQQWAVGVGFVLPGPDNPGFCLDGGTRIYFPRGLFPLCWALLWFLSSPGCWDCALGLSWHCWSGQDSQPWRWGAVWSPHLGVPAQPANGERWFDGAFWELETLEEAPHYQKVFLKLCHGQGARGHCCSLGVPLPPPRLGGHGCGAALALHGLGQAHERGGPMSELSHSRYPWPWSSPGSIPAPHGSPQCPLPVCSSGMSQGPWAGDAPRHHQRWAGR